jgi:hypothetical protein
MVRILSSDDQGVRRCADAALPHTKGSSDVFAKRKAAKELAARDDALRAYVESLVEPEGTFSRSEEDRLTEYMAEHGIPPDGLPLDVQRTIRLGYAAAGEFVAVETTLLLKQGETAVEVALAHLLKEVRKREFRGGSRGVSVPLGHGVRYRAGAVRGHMVDLGTEWQEADVGLLTVTTQRIVFTGRRKTIEFQFAKLATLNVYTNAIDLGVTNRQTTSSFRVDHPEVIAGMIRAACGLHQSGREPEILREAARQAQ